MEILLYKVKYAILGCVSTDVDHFYFKVKHYVDIVLLAVPTTSRSPGLIPLERSLLSIRDKDI